MIKIIGNILNIILNKKICTKNERLWLDNVKKSCELTHQDYDAFIRLKNKDRENTLYY